MKRHIYFLTTIFLFSFLGLTSCEQTEPNKSNGNATTENKETNSTSSSNQSNDETTVELQSIALETYELNLEQYSSAYIKIIPTPSNYLGSYVLHVCQNPMKDDFEIYLEPNNTCKVAAALSGSEGGGSFYISNLAGNIKSPKCRVNVGYFQE